MSRLKFRLEFTLTSRLSVSDSTKSAYNISGKVDHDGATPLGAVPSKSTMFLKTYNSHKARFFLLVDLWEFFSDLGSGGGGGRKKINKKALKMTDDWSFSELFFFIFRALFLLIYPEKQ